MTLTVPSVTRGVVEGGEFPANVGHWHLHGLSAAAGMRRHLDGLSILLPPPATHTGHVRFGVGDPAVGVVVGGVVAHGGHALTVGVT